MKNWAISMGATHYMHWFQPMTGVTAEKHEVLNAMTELRKPIDELEKLVSKKNIGPFLFIQTSYIPFEDKIKNYKINSKKMVCYIC